MVCSGSAISDREPAIERLTGVNEASAENDVVAFSSKAIMGRDHRRRNTPSRAVALVTDTTVRRSAASSGSGRHSVASTTLNIVVIAAMPSESVPIAVAVRPSPARGNG